MASFPKRFQYGLSSDSLVIGPAASCKLLIPICVHASPTLDAAYLLANSSLLQPANIPANLVAISASPNHCAAILACVLAIFSCCHLLNAFAHAASIESDHPLLDQSAEFPLPIFHDEPAISLISSHPAPVSASISHGTGPGDSPVGPSVVFVSSTGTSGLVASELSLYGTPLSPVSGSYTVQSSCHEPELGAVYPSATHPSPGAELYEPPLLFP